jgi:hypothetical protein
MIVFPAPPALAARHDAKNMPRGAHRETAR